MSETVNFVRVGEPICTCNDPKYSGCMKHFPPPPAKAYVVESPSPIAGKADEMPEEVRSVIKDVRRNREYGILPGPSGNSIRWLADDRERLLAALDKAKENAHALDAAWNRDRDRLLARIEDMAQTERDAIATLTALDKAQRERDEAKAAWKAYDGRREGCEFCAECGDASEIADGYRASTRTTEGK